MDESVESVLPLSGTAAKPWDGYNPDWVSSLHLGHSKKISLRGRAGNHAWSCCEERWKSTKFRPKACRIRATTRGNQGKKAKNWRSWIRNPRYCVWLRCRRNQRGRDGNRNSNWGVWISVCVRTREAIRPELVQKWRQESELLHWFAWIRRCDECL